MFEIEYKGGNSIIVSTKKTKIIVDPNISIIGLKNLSTDNAVELATEGRFAINSNDSGLIIDGPGEYGVGNIHIYGIAARRHIDQASEGLKSTIYRLEIGDARVGIIGNIDNKLSDEQLEGLGLIDILVIPVGGSGYTLDAVGAASLVRQIDPKIVMPIHYADSQIKYEVPQDDLATFIKEMDAPVETVSKYKLKQLPITQTTLTIIEMTRS